MSAKELVSVVIPSFNHKDYIIEAIKSCLDQTYSSIEVIVIDDGSQDGSPDLVRGHFGSDKRVHLLVQENEGAHRAINRGLSAANGGYMAILNSDDRFHPRRIELLMDKMRAHAAENRLVFSDVEFIDGVGAPIEDHRRIRDYLKLKELCRQRPPKQWLLVGNPTMSTSNFLFSRDLRRTTGEFAPLRYTHDWDWALRATNPLPPLWIRESLLEYRIHDANTVSEGDRWRHIHENAYVQVAALVECLRGHPARTPNPMLDTVMRAWMENESVSFPAVAYSLLHAIAGATRQDLLLLAKRARGGFLMQVQAQAAGMPVDFLLPLRGLAELCKAGDVGAKLIAERTAWIEDLQQRLADADKSITAQTQLIDERNAWIEDLQRRLAAADEVAAGQARLIDERNGWIEDLKRRLGEADKANVAQTQFIDERDAWIEDLQQRLTEADRAINAQTKMIDERDAWIADLHQHRAETEAQLRQLRDDRLIRFALGLRRVADTVTKPGR